MLSQKEKRQKKKNLEICKFTKLHKFCMYVLIKFFKTLSNLFICELNNVKNYLLACVQTIEGNKHLTAISIITKSLRVGNAKEETEN
jgi:hypothetical protein